MSPLDLAAVSQNNLRNQKKGVMSVSAYTTWFSEQLRHLPQMSLRDQKERFMEGLKSDVEGRIGLHTGDDIHTSPRTGTLTELMELALKTESALRTATKPGGYQPSTSSFTSSASGTSPMEISMLHNEEEERRGR